MRKTPNIYMNEVLCKCLCLVMCLFFSMSLGAKVPEVRVFGYVLDSDNRGIELANVYVEGTTIGTTTNQNGYYDLTVEMGDTIIMVYSMIGYESFRQHLYTTNKVLGVNVNVCGIVRK